MKKKTKEIEDYVDKKLDKTNKYIKSEIDKIDRRIKFDKKLDEIMLIVFGTALFIKLITIID